MLRLGDFLPPCTPTLHRAVRYHWKARFDPLGLDPAEHQEFRTLCRQLKSALRQLRRDVRMKDRKECRPAGRPQRRHPPEDSLR